MTDTIEAEIELKAEDLDKYCQVATNIVEELQSFLGSHYEELLKCNMVIHGKGIAMDMPISAQDPQYSAHIHKLKSACDAFVNSMRGHF